MLITLHLCVLCGCQNKQYVLPYTSTSLTYRFLWPKRRVFTARYGLSPYIKPIVLVLQGLSHDFIRGGGCHKTESHVSHRFGQLIYLRTPHSGCEVLQHVLECVVDALLQTVSSRHAKHCNITTSPSFLLPQGQVARNCVSNARYPNNYHIDERFISKIWKGHQTIF